MREPSRSLPSPKGYSLVSHVHVKCVAILADSNLVEHCKQGIENNSYTNTEHTTARIRCYFLYVRINLERKCGREVSAGILKQSKGRGGGG